MRHEFCQKRVSIYNNKATSTRCDIVSFLALMSPKFSI